MKYELEIIINKPREEVIKLFDNSENLKKWQKGLMEFEHVSGEPGQEGARSKLLYLMNGRETEMTEVITKRAFPEEFHGVYEAHGVYNIQENYFSEEGAGKTKWVSKSEFRFTSMLMKIMAFIMPGAFKSQSFKFMKSFKEFAEDGKTVN